MIIHQKSNIDTNNDAIVKGSCYLFQPIILGPSSRLVFGGVFTIHHWDPSAKHFPTHFWAKMLRCLRGRRTSSAWGWNPRVRIGAWFRCRMSCTGGVNLGCIWRFQNCHLINMLFWCFLMCLWLSDLRLFWRKWSTNDSSFVKGVKTL